MAVPMNMSRGELEELVNQDVEDGQIDHVSEIGNEEYVEDEADDTIEKKGCILDEGEGIMHNWNQT